MEAAPLPAAAVAGALIRRDDDDDDDYDRFWYTSTGYAVKWALFMALVLLLILYVVLGHIHAKRRIRRGLVPLPYHRWLVNRSALGRVHSQYPYPPQPPYQPAAYPPPGEYYGMYAMPPPVYDPNAPRPPMYHEVSKAQPTQAMSGASGPPSHQQHHEAFMPPAGPPPPATEMRRD